MTSFVETYRKNCLTFDFDIEGIMDYEQARGKICYKLVNTELNKELLSEVPHIPFHDLSIVFYVLIDSIPRENGSIMVNNKFMDDWGVDPERMKDIIFEVNTMHVMPEEVLSYHLYRYSRDTGLVELVA